MDDVRAQEPRQVPLDVLDAGDERETVGAKVRPRTAATWATGVRLAGEPRCAPRAGSRGQSVAVRRERSAPMSAAPLARRSRAASAEAAPGRAGCPRRRAITSRLASGASSPGASCDSSSSASASLSGPSRELDDALRVLEPRARQECPIAPVAPQAGSSPRSSAERRRSASVGARPTRACSGRPSGCRASQRRPAAPAQAR